MSSLISLTFSCSVCSYEIRGEYEAEDFDYPVFCPKCGRQNQLPARTAMPTVQTTVVEPPAQQPQVVHKDVLVETSSNAVVAVAPSLAQAGQLDKPSTVEPSPNQATSSAPPQPSKPSMGAPSLNRIAWRFRPVAGTKQIVPLRNCVAIDGLNRIIAALGTEVYALVPGATGCEVAWRFATADHIPGSPVIGPSGSIYVHSGDGLLHALNADGLSARSPTKVGPALGWATPLVDDADRVWISPATGGLVRVDESGQTTARPFWRHPSRLDCTGAILGHVLYIGAEDQYVHAVDLNAQRGRDLWNQQQKVGLTGWYINSAIAVDGDSRIIAASRDDTLYALELDGSVVWSRPLNGRAIGSPVITDAGTIIIGLTTQGRNSESLAGRLIGVHCNSGQLAWSVEVDAPIESTPLIGDAGEVYFGDNAGRIHAVTIQGRRLWSEQVGSAVRSAGTILPIGQIVFGTDEGSLVSLRCTSQSIAGGWPKLLGSSSNRCPMLE